MKKTILSLALMAAVANVQAAEKELNENKNCHQGLLDYIEARIRSEEAAAMKHADGVIAPDFTLKDLKGKPLSLKSLRGKYVILDFWGSWCGWCIKGIPQMKEYYKKYSGKFEILGIDCNDTDQKWRDAVKKYQLPWLHVYNPRDSKVLKDYGVQGFPTKIIVGPDGKIVKTIIGEDPAFYTFLDKLFGKK
jgi:thiol-disulfide isomerase/thioredoxin